MLELAADGTDPRAGALEHRPGGRRGRIGARPDQPRTPSTAPTVGTTSSWPRSCTYLAPKGFDPTEDRRSTTSAPSLLRTLAEICGLDRGFSHGRGGSMHLQWKEAGAIGTNAIVGGGVPLAAGSAWAHQFAGTDAVAVTYFGDGASNIGSTLETFNLAAAWKLPICFFIENNQYAVSTNVDGGDGRTAAVSARARVRHRQLEGRRDEPAGRLPRHAGGRSRTCAPATARPIVEADVYRYFHQNGPFPGSGVRIPHQGRGEGLEAARPDHAGRRRTCCAASILDPGRDQRHHRAGQAADGRDRPRDPRAAARRQARPAAHQARGVARPELGRRRCPR